MKAAVEKRPVSSVGDITSLALTTWGVGYLPLMPGTFGSAVGVLIYLAVSMAEASDILHSLLPQHSDQQISALVWATNSVLLALLVLIGIWASGRAIELLGNLDPPEAVVDEVMGQLITLLFIPLGAGWPFVLAGFLLFRLFDIWKPYPIDSLQDLPGGVGVCADDIVAGMYAGICLALIYAVTILL